MHVKSSELRQILDNIPDRRQRDTIANIMSSQIVKQVRCLSEDIYEGKGKNKSLVREGCKGRIIAHIYQDGKVRMAVSDGKCWLRAFRHRLDGAMGFQCWCKNDSRLCPAEASTEGIVRNAVNKKAIEEVWEKLGGKMADYPIKNGVQVIDGFAIEEIK